MTNYENDIMDLLPGDTPKAKYEYLKDLKTKAVLNDKGEVLFISTIDHIEFAKWISGHDMETILQMFVVTFIR